MRFLLSRTDALGDLVVSLTVMERILQREPEAEVHWLVRDYTAPLLAGQPGVAGVHLREPGQDLAGLIRRLAPLACLNLGHRDWEVTVAAQRAGVPIRVARTRKLPQILAATHRLWRGRYGSGRHEAQNLLDFLSPWGWQGGAIPLPRLQSSPMDLGPGPTLGVVLRGSGAGAFPSDAWWGRALRVLRDAGWQPRVLAPPEASELPAGDLTTLMARLAGCQVVLGPSTGPLHIAAALGRPVLCLMGRRPNHAPDRWAPLGPRVQVLQYPGPEADLAGGLDRLDPRELLPHLERLR